MYCDFNYFEQNSITFIEGRIGHSYLQKYIQISYVMFAYPNNKDLGWENWHGTGDVLAMLCHGEKRAGCSNNTHIREGIKQDIRVGFEITQ